MLREKGLADQRLDDYVQRLDQSDAAGQGTGGSRVKNLAEKIRPVRERRERYKEILAELDRTGENQISLTDPDSRALAAHTHVAVGYNAQVAVDTKQKLIVEQQVTNQVIDMGLLTQTAEPAKEILGVETVHVVADRGYFKAEDIEACEKAGMMNAIAPGIIETALTTPIKERPEIWRTYAAHTVFNRWGAASEVAAAVAFLAADASSCISGATLMVDGGWTAVDGPPTGLTATRPN